MLTARQHAALRREVAWFKQRGAASPSAMEVEYEHQTWIDGRQHMSRHARCARSSQSPSGGGRKFGRGPRLPCPPLTKRRANCGSGSSVLRPQTLKKRVVVTLDAEASLCAGSFGRLARTLIAIAAVRGILEAPERKRAGFNSRIGGRPWTR